MKLYKYANRSLLSRALTATAQACIKFDYPKNYNDPLELFLTPQGVERDPRVIAYYKEILGEVPQLPTSCFSKRPDIIPMWAHYGEEHTGFVMEFDEKALCNTFPVGYLQDVEYVDETGFIEWEPIQYAAGTLKPRHTCWVQTEAFRRAYFTKNQCWAYEKERRLIVDHRNFTQGKPLMILRVPARCLTALISGVRSNRGSQAKLSAAAKRFKCPHYIMKIGRSSCVPYFVDEAGKSFSFRDSRIAEADNVCAKCSESQSDNAGSICQWCMIDKSHEAEAHMTNPFTMIDSLGMREKYGYGFALNGIKPVGKLLKSSTNRSSRRRR